MTCVSSNIPYLVDIQNSSKINQEVKDILNEEICTVQINFIYHFVSLWSS